ncbi:MAG: hypothetical protein JO210_14895 [Acidobacteriaceae bacterium]|nr:hypothetical protein [Acidobacteriaceae bacterium]
MNRLISLTCAILSFVGLCSAGTVCTGGSLASYISLGSGGCAIGTNTLFNFTVLSGTTLATPIAPGDITISPFSLGLTAATTVTASTGNLLEALFTYQIAGNPYVSSSITLADSSQTGDGAVTDVQNFCAGGTFGPDGLSGCSGTPGTLIALNGVNSQDSTALGGVTLLSVTDDFTLDGGLSGSATGGTITDRFVATPEPISFLLTGLGLGLAFTFQRSIRRSCRRR